MVPGEWRGCQRVNHGYPLPASRQFRDVTHRCVQSACRMDLFTQARNLGIQTEFIDGQGHRHVMDAAALKIILDALPARVPQPLLNQAVVVRSGRPLRTELSHAAVPPLRWKIMAGRKGTWAGAHCDRRSSLPPGLPHWACA